MRADCNLVPKSPLKLTPPSPEVSAKNLKEAYEMCLDVLDYSKRCKERIEELFLEVAPFLEHVEELNKKGDLESLNLDRLEELSQKINDIKSLFDEPEFNYCFNDAIQSYIFHQELDIAKIVVKPTPTKEELQAKQLDWIYAHKYWLFSLAGGIDSVMEVIKQALQTWPPSH